MGIKNVLLRLPAMCSIVNYSYITKVTMFFKKKKETAAPAIKMKTIICIMPMNTSLRVMF